MPSAGVSIAPELAQRERAWVDFGVDETWEPAPPRRPRRNAVTGHTRSAPRQPAPAPAVPRPRVNVLSRASDDVEPRPRAAAARRSAAAPPSAGARQSAAAPPPVAAQRPRPTGAARPAPSGARATAARRPAAASARPAAASARPVAASAPPTRTAAPTVPGPAPARRTVTIRGRGAERELAFPSYDRARRPATRRHERPGFQPDRTAMWAVMLGVLLVLVACASAHAASLPRAVAAHHAGPAPRVAIVRTVSSQR